MLPSLGRSGGLSLQSHSASGEVFNDPTEEVCYLDMRRRGSPYSQS